LEKEMKQYHKLLKDILENGEKRSDRTGVGTISVFGRQLRFNLNKGFPAITTKKLAWRAVVGELLWFIEGSGDERRLAEITHGTRDGVTTIWTPNALSPEWQNRRRQTDNKIRDFDISARSALVDGDRHATVDSESSSNSLGRVYGVQWRSWRRPIEMAQYNTWENTVDGMKPVPVEEYHVDQLKVLIDGIKQNPYSRRHILTAWNPGELEEMALPPCHVLCQFYVNKKNQLSCHMYQRSVDVFLGLPFNIASYALLTNMIARVCKLKVGELIISTGDTHIYLDHQDQVREQLTRSEYPLPELYLNPEITDIDRYTMNDINLIEYRSHGAIKAKMAV
jgi:thymidylate synthase